MQEGGYRGVEFKGRGTEELLSSTARMGSLREKNVGSVEFELERLTMIRNVETWKR